MPNLQNVQNVQKAFNNPIGFTSVDNRIMYLQAKLSTSAFSLLLRVYRQTVGYGILSKALANSYFQKTCNLSKNSITKAIKELEDSGILLVKRKSRAASLYQVSEIGVDKIYREVKAEIELDSEGANLETSVAATISVSKPKISEGFEDEYFEQETVEEIVEDSNSKSFEYFFSAFDKSVNKSGCKKEWDKLKKADHLEIMNHVTTYVESTPDKFYRKNPATYLREECWKDEVIIPNASSSSTKGSESDSSGIQSVIDKSLGRPCYAAPVQPVRDVIQDGSEASKVVDEFFKNFGRKKSNS